jgi:purine nucleosidase/pyrimidine-specific ribonucleoside hydrolase
MPAETGIAMSPTDGTTPRIPILLDTDIGDDIDDAIALLFALGSPEFDLLGVTTVYGNVQTRARIARRLLQLAGRGEIPVVPGCERPFGFDYHEGTAPEHCSQRNAVADDQAPLPCTPTATQFIIDCVRQHPRPMHIVTIGAMTNVATALCTDPSLAKRLAGVTSLAGYLPPRNTQVEWNVRYDPLAAQTIARSGVPWTVVAADVQGKNGLTSAEFAALQSSNRPAALFLLDLVVLMCRHKGAGNPNVRTIDDVPGVHVADVLALASFLIPDQIGLQTGRVHVADNGAMNFTPDPAGPHRYATNRLAENDYRPEILRRLLAIA